MGVRKSLNKSTKIYLGKNFEICPKKLGLKCKYEHTFISLTSWSTHPAWFSLLFSFSKRSALIVPRYFSWRVNQICFSKRFGILQKKSQYYKIPKNSIKRQKSDSMLRLFFWKYFPFLFQNMVHPKRYQKIYNFFFFFHWKGY